METLLKMLFVIEAFRTLFYILTSFFYFSSSVQQVIVPFNDMKGDSSGDLILTKLGSAIAQLLSWTPLIRISRASQLENILS